MKRTFVMVMVLVLLASFFSSAVYGQEHVASVGKVTGTLYIQQGEGAEWTAAAENTPVYLGDFLKTESDSYADVVFLSGGVIAVNQNTTIQVTGIRDAEDVTERSFIQNVIITSGEIWAKITKQQEEIQFETKGGVVSIKGTEFVIEEDPDKDETKVSVLEGEIAFLDNNNELTLYNAGKQVQVIMNSITVNEHIPADLRNELVSEFGGFGSFVNEMLQNVDQIINDVNTNPNVNIPNNVGPTGPVGPTNPPSNFPF